MGKIHLLDCTLRDGGYVNDWRFGKEAIPEIIRKLEQTGIDILEIGFLKNEPYQKDRTVFQRAGQISHLLAKHEKRQIPYQAETCDSGMRYAAMIEVINPLPLELLEEAGDTQLAIIRVIIWKRMLKEGFAYCRGIVEKGYQLCVQPARVEQYSDQEFIQMLQLFGQLNPLAVYVVDSWGTQSSKSLLHYMELADQYLADGIGLGYHGHNNLMQAYGTAVDFIQAGFERELFLDASIYGIGRGAGNLNLELVMQYLNQEWDRKFRITPVMELYSKYIRPIYKNHAWGYSMAHYITAVCGCNPNFGAYYEDKDLAAEDIAGIIESIPKGERIIYTDEKAQQYEQRYFAQKGGS